MRIERRIKAPIAMRRGGLNGSRCIGDDSEIGRKEKKGIVLPGAP
jgi:hypothetical protein